MVRHSKSNFITVNFIYVSRGGSKFLVRGRPLPGRRVGRGLGSGTASPGRPTGYIYVPGRGRGPGLGTPSPRPLPVLRGRSLVVPGRPQVEPDPLVVDVGRPLPVPGYLT